MDSIWLPKEVKGNLFKHTENELLWSEESEMFLELLLKPPPSAKSSTWHPKCLLHFLTHIYLFTGRFSDDIEGCTSYTSYIWYKGILIWELWKVEVKTLKPPCTLTNQIPQVCESCLNRFRTDLITLSWMGIDQATGWRWTGQLKEAWAMATWLTLSTRGGLVDSLVYPAKD